MQGAAEAGPARRVYRLTDAGREQLEGWSLMIEREIEALQRFRDAYRHPGPPLRERPHPSSPTPTRRALIPRIPPWLSPPLALS